MHELGILVRIVRTVEAAAKQHNVSKVTEIALDVGEICGALPQYMEIQFPLAVNHNPLFEDCQLKVNVIKAQGACTKCHRDFLLKQHKGICPHCGNDDFVTTAGMELQICNITAI